MEGRVLFRLEPFQSPLQEFSSPEVSNGGPPLVIPLWRDDVPRELLDELSFYGSANVQKRVTAPLTKKSGSVLGLSWPDVDLRLYGIQRILWNREFRRSSSCCQYSSFIQKFILFSGSQTGPSLFFDVLRLKTLPLNVRRMYGLLFFVICRKVSLGACAASFSFFLRHRVFFSARTLFL